MAVQLSALRERARRRANMEDSDFVEDEELNQYISDSYAELYDLLVSKFEDYYVADPLEFSISSGSSTYALPADFYKLIGLDRSVGGGDYVEVKPFNFNDRNRRRIGDRLRSGSPTARYRILGSNLRFSPADQAAGDYLLWYVPRYSELTEDTDEVDGVNGWEEYIVIDAAIKCLIKEESNANDLYKAKAEIKQRIEEMAANRDAGEPQRIPDVTMSGYDDPLFLGY